MRREPPGPGQESVWNYPRPPRVEPTSRRVRVLFAGQVVADTHRALRVLETSHPPTYYLPPDDVRPEFLIALPKRSYCEFKGSASYWGLRAGEQESTPAAWSYAAPSRGFEALRGYLAFYPSRVEACYVDDERVLSQAGDFYGGWITSDLVGPFKGGPGTLGW